MGGAGNCMRAVRGRSSTRQVLRGARNHLEAQRGAEISRDPRRQMWQWNRIYPRGDYRPKQINFTGNENILERLPRNPTPEDYFKLYITEENIDCMVTQTNLYATQFLENEQDNLREHSLVYQRKPTDRAEMVTMLAVLILMGIIHKPRLIMYWSKDSLLATPIFNQVMRRDRFLLLLRLLHFADNSQYKAADPNRHTLYKITQIINMIKEKYTKVYSPGKNLSMDESLILFKGRLSFKQFISSKRVRFGIKLYQLCTSNGILLDFLVNQHFGSTEGTSTTRDTSQLLT